MWTTIIHAVFHIFVYFICQRFWIWKWDKDGSLTLVTSPLSNDLSIMCLSMWSHRGGGLTRISRDFWQIILSARIPTIYVTVRCPSLRHVFTLLEYCLKNSCKNPLCPVTLVRTSCMFSQFLFPILLSESLHAVTPIKFPICSDS